MQTTYCPSCETAITETSTPNFCPNCGYHLKVEQESNTTKNTIHNNVTETPKNTGKLKTVGISILILAALLIGLFSPKLFGDSEKQFATMMTESYFTQITGVINEEEVTEMDITFSDVQTTLIEQESNNTAGIYEVTGEFTHDQTIYTFTSNISFYDGYYFYNDAPEFDEK